MRDIKTDFTLTKVLMVSVSFKIMTIILLLSNLTFIVPHTIRIVTYPIISTILILVETYRTVTSFLGMYMLNLKYEPSESRKVELIAVTGIHKMEYLDSFTFLG